VEQRGRESRPLSATVSVSTSTSHILNHARTHAQGLLTNDVARLTAATATPPPMYAALLTPAGRVVADLHLSVEGSWTAPTSRPPPSACPALLADVDAATAPALLRLLSMYKLRADVDVADASDEWGVWWWKGEGGEAPPPPPHSLLSPLFLPDPRGLPGLGWRALIPHATAEAAGLGSDGGSPDPAAATAAPPLLRAARFALGVAEGGELAGLVPLEAGLDGLAGIAFDKGCYVGQELVARTHFRGEVRKRVVGFVVEGGSLPPAPGAALAFLAAEGGAAPASAPARPPRPPGTVLAVDEVSGTGLALVRTATALPAGVLEVEGGGGRVRLVRPGWWPREW